MRYLFLLTIFMSTIINASPKHDGGVISWKAYGSDGLLHRNTLRSSINSQLSNSERDKGVIYLNAIRKGAGLIEYTSNALLDQASQNHTDYLILNDVFSHYEESGKNGYTGVNPWDRGTHVGYSYTTYGENISAGSETIEESIDSLMSAIYHRFGFLNFDSNEIGIGATFSSGYYYDSAYGFNMANSTNTSNTKNLNPSYVLWPYSNYKNAQTSFNNSEFPDPVPECPSGGIVSNPVSIHFNSAKSAAITMNDFKLFNSSGNEITETKVVDFENDRFGVFSMHSFSLDTKYRALFTYTEGGVSKNKSWYFNTRRYEDKRYEVHENGTYDVISGTPYIIHLKAADCTTTMWGYAYSGNATIERLGSDIYRISATSNVHFTSPFEFDLHIANSDNAIEPSSELGSDILDLYMMGILPAIISSKNSTP